MAYGKPDGEHGTPRGELDPEYDYLDSIKTAANSGKLVQVSVVYMGTPSVRFADWGLRSLVCPRAGTREDLSHLKWRREMA